MAGLPVTYWFHRKNTLAGSLVLQCLTDIELSTALEIHDDSQRCVYAAHLFKVEISDAFA
jgi:hypothetical protein